MVQKMRHILSQGSWRLARWCWESHASLSPQLGEGFPKVSTLFHQKISYLKVEDRLGSSHVAISWRPACNFISSSRSNVERIIGLKSLVPNGTDNFGFIYQNSPRTIIFPSSSLHHNVKSFHNLTNGNSLSLCNGEKRCLPSPILQIIVLMLTCTIVKSRTIAVRLISMALTGYYRTLRRPRTHRPLSMMKYDPVGKIDSQI